MSGPAVLVAVAVGGGLGAATRHALSVVWSSSAGEIDWPTMTVNGAGCALIGLLMALLERIRAGSLVRPFVGVGVLGGFTTFSTYAVGAAVLFRDGRPAFALAYLVGTLLVALLATWLGALVGHRLLRPPARPEAPPVRSAQGAVRGTPGVVRGAPGTAPASRIGSALTEPEGPGA